MRIVVLALLAAAGCGGPDSLPRPAEGYRALRVVEPFRIPWALGWWELGAGLVLVGDSAVNGETLLCGVIPYREIAVTPTATCARYGGSLITLNAEKPVANQPFPAPPGAIEEFRLR